MIQGQCKAVCAQWHAGIQGEVPGGGKISQERNGSDAQEVGVLVRGSTA